MLTYIGYANVLREQLSRVVLQKEALMCNGSCEKCCVEAIDRYYNIVRTVLDNAIYNSCIPTKKIQNIKKHWWNDELDDLHHQVIAATTFWRPRSGVHVVNDNRLQWKYRYKLAIKQAEKNAYEIVNEELFRVF